MAATTGITVLTSLAILTMHLCCTAMQPSSAGLRMVRNQRQDWSGARQARFMTNQLNNLIDYLLGEAQWDEADKTRSEPIWPISLLLMRSPWVIQIIHCLSRHCLP